MIDTTLVVLAAGIGSRYGAGIKQLERVGVCGEIIVDYSVFDAIDAGFNKVVFIIRHEIEKDFREIIGDRIEKFIPVEYVYQELNNIPKDLSVPDCRIKPWGTGHAVLACADVVKEPFAVINADDYYGKQSFRIIHDYLVSKKESKASYCMAGFFMNNTLSRFGAVTRGICNVGKDNMLFSVTETYNVHMVNDKIEGTTASGETIYAQPDTIVSMNMWGFTPDIFGILKEGFDTFIREICIDENREKKEKAEYLLPAIVGELLTEGTVSVRMLRTEDEWFGITYQEDKARVTETVKRITEEGQYPKPLFN